MEKINLSDSANELPAPGEYDSSTEIVTTTDHSGGDNYLLVDEDDFHKGIANRSSLRRKIFLKWDTTNGFFKVQDDVVACGHMPPLIATVVGANFSWQLWDNMQLLCENKDPGKKHKLGDGRLAQLGEWNENGVISKRECATCPFNSRNGAKGQKVCKDAMQLTLNVLLEGNERTVSMQTSNFKLLGDFDDFLYKLKAMGKRIGEVTLKISKGDAQDIRGKKMYGWKIEKIADKPLWDYATDLLAQSEKSR